MRGGKKTGAESKNAENSSSGSVKAFIIGSESESKDGLVEAKVSSLFTSAASNSMTKSSLASYSILLSRFL